MIIQGTAASETLTGSGNDDEIYGAGGNDSIVGLAGFDWLEGEAGDDTLRGGADGDELWGGPGNDILDGGTGIDLAAFDNAPTGVNVNLVTGLATGEGNDVLIDVEEVVGSLHNDTLIGNAGDNAFDPLYGQNFVDGGAGRDAVLYWWEGALGSVTANLSTGLATFPNGTDTLVGIEDIYGSDFSDSLTGDANANLLDGMLGNDTLKGLGGNDTLEGGAGNDTAVFSGSQRDYVITPGAADGEFVVSGPDGIDELFNVEILAFDDGNFKFTEGSGNADTLSGGSDDDIIRGGGGNDSLSGGGGDDALYGDEGHDALDGGAGNDYLDGGTGNDTMRGGEGDDTYVVDSAGDSVIEPDSILASQPGGPGAGVSIGSGIDRVVASVTYSLGNAIENLTLGTGAGGIAGTGNALANLIVGNEANNVLRGQGGSDTLDGGAGIDTAVYSGAIGFYEFSSMAVQGGDAGEGTDTLAGIERLAFSDKNVALDLDGNAGSVAKVLATVFGYESLSNEVYAGIGLSIMDGGASYEALMGLAIDVALGPGASYAEVVSRLYLNVIGETPDAATVAVFVGLLDAGTFTKTTLGAMAGNYMGVPAAVADGLMYI